MNKVAMIMAGGTGTRFWPMSRRHRPKQVLSIGDEPVMLRRTIDRLEQVYDHDRIYVITAEAHRGLVEDVCERLPAGHVIGEPEGRDTAACAGLGGLLTEEWHDSETVIGVFPADHRITPVESFADSVETASRVCSEWGGITTFGVEPAFPSTGYGYIEYDSDSRRTLEDNEVYRVRRFTEKPNREKAREFLDEGRFLWNSGMFFWTAEQILGEIQKQMPDLHEGLEQIRSHLRTNRDLPSALGEFYGQLPMTSVDYGIMESANTVWTLPVSFEWTDLGTWDALEDVMSPDDAGNITVGDVETIDTTNSVIVSNDNRLVGTVGVDNLVVVTTDDAVLVIDKDRAEDVKALVNLLEDKGREDVL